MSDPTKAVFLSYASQDAEAAKRICDALRAAGVEVWFDQSELVGGDAWDQKIRKQIKDCALLIPIISANTQSRTEGYFRLEWRLADQRTHLMGRNKAFLLPVAIDGTTDADADVPDSFSAVQWTKAPGGEVTAAFPARVKKLLGGEVGPVSDRPIGSSAPSEAGQRPAPPGKPRPWLIPVIFGAVAIAVATVWLTRQTGPVPTLESPAATRQAGKPVSAAGELVAKAWEQMNKADLARAELEIADGFSRRATESDPNDADAWAAWSQVDSWTVYHNFDASPARREAARTKAVRAMQHAPNSYESRLAQACYLVRGQAGGDQFASAGKTQHQMRLNKPQAQVQVRAKKTIVDPHRRSRFRGPQIPMLITIAGVVVENSITSGDLFTDDVPDLIIRRAAMQAGGDHNADAIARNARRFQSLQKRRQNDWVRRRPSDIANRNGGAAFSGGKFANRGAGNRVI